jgi:hypothetical protein
MGRSGSKSGRSPTLRPATDSTQPCVVGTAHRGFLVAQPVRRTGVIEGPAIQLRYAGRRLSLFHRRRLRVPAELAFAPATLPLGESHARLGEGGIKPDRRIHANGRSAAAAVVPTIKVLGGTYLSCCLMVASCASRTQRIVRVSMCGFPRRTAGAGDDQRRLGQRSRRL